MKNSILILIIGVLIVFALWGGNYYYATQIISEKSEISQNSGLFGDMFGAVNALFSGLAFLGLIYTIIMQSEELRLQREELKLTREEMENTRKEIEGQKISLESQEKILRQNQLDNVFKIALDKFLKINEYFAHKNQQTFLSKYDDISDQIQSAIKSGTSQVIKNYYVGTGYSIGFDDLLGSFEALLIILEKYDEELKKTYLKFFDYHLTPEFIIILFSFLPFYSNKTREIERLISDFKFSDVLKQEFSESPELKKFFQDKGYISN